MSFEQELDYWKRTHNHACKNCLHDVTDHYPLHLWLTGCKVENCNCLDFEK